MNRGEFYPLTHAQLGRWYLEKYYTGTSINSIGAVLTLNGDIDYDLLEKAINITIENNDGMRLRLLEDQDEPLQYIIEYSNRVLERFDFSVEGSEALNRWSLDQTSVAFDLIDADLFYFALIKVSDKQGGFYAKFHHLISDAWTMTILGNQIMESYFELINGQINLKHRQPSYLDWVITEQDYSKSQHFAEAKKFWAENLKEMPPVAFIKPRPLFGSTSARRRTYIMNQEQTNVIQLYSKQNVNSVSTLFYAAFAAYICKVSGLYELIIATMVLNRPTTKEKLTAGMFVNVVPLKIVLNEKINASDLIKEVRNNWKAVSKYREYPFNLILEDVRDRLGTQQKLYDVVLSYQNARFIDDMQANYNTDWVFNGHITDSLIIHVNDREGRGQLILDYDYMTEVFSDEEIGWIHEDLMSMLFGMVQNPNIEIADIDLKYPDKFKGNTQNNDKIHDIREMVKLKIAATFTSEPAEDYIAWWGKQFGYNFKVEFAGYNQVFQELLNPHSLLAGNKEGINLLLVRFEDFIRDDHGNDKDKAAKIEKIYTDLIEAIVQLTNTVPLIMGIFPVSTHLELSNEIQDTIKTLNYRLVKDLEQYRHVYLLDLTNIQDHYLIEDVFDEWKDREGHMPFSDEYYAAIGTEVARKIIAIKKQHFKVIVVDCDNTLWNGICGEVGTLGVQVEEGYLALHALLIEKHREGFLLAICSKNNEADVWEVFEQNPGMLLKREHIVSWRINWQEKSLNIREIAQELNLGLDSFIFIDDNPLECAKMVEECPEVLTLQLPEAEQDIPIFLQHIWAFDRARVTKEDTERSSMYAAEQQRTSMKADAISLDDFLKGLELKVSMRELQQEEIERAAQLTQRTNQFNLSTIRRSEQEIQELMNDKAYVCFIIEAADRFGDYGIVGLVILQSSTNELFIDTFLMSCRVLGRKVEDVVLSGIRRYAEEQSKNIIQAKYIPTRKNQLILAFIEENGWVIEKEDEGGTYYTIPIPDLPVEIEFIDFYYSQNYSDTRQQLTKESTNTSAMLDHVAIAVRDFDDCGRYYSDLGYNLINSVEDPRQNSLLSLYESEEYIPLEFVAPVDEKSPSYNLVERHGETPYHLCFKAPNIREFLARLSDVDFEVISQEKPAVLFGYNPVMFIRVHQVGLIELLENEVAIIPPKYTRSTIQVVTSSLDKAISFYKLLGYEQLKNFRDFNQNTVVTMIGRHGEKLEIIIPLNQQSDAFRFLSERGAGVFRLVFDLDNLDADGKLIDEKRMYNIFLNSGQKRIVTAVKTFTQYNTNQLEKTKHREYLFPVKHMTGEALLRLPVFENVGYSVREYQPPGTETEEKLVRIWEEVLKIEQIGINDSFFERGGDSLKALRVMTRLIAHGWKLSVKDFFTYPTVKQLADLIEGKADLNHEDKDKNSIVYPECNQHSVNDINISREKIDLGSILLTGATGFLGIHILNDLVSLTTGKVYCLVRGKDHGHARQRLIEQLQDYFPGKRWKTISDRLVVIPGDCSKNHLGLSDQQYMIMGKTIETVIHSAALVKHYGIWEEFSVSNVDSTQNIIKFCFSNNIRLAHISTESVSGNHLVKQDLQDVLFTENDFFVGQNYLGNAYVRSKFEAELMVLKAIHEGLTGQIFRMGIITGRYRDGLFQSNIDENAQYNRLKFLIDVGMVPEDLLGQDVQFTPVDLASQAVVLLMQVKETWNKVFHLYNNNFCKVKQLLKAAEILDLTVMVTDYETFSGKLRAIADDPKRKDLIAKMIPDLTSDYRLDFEDNITMDNTITCKYLERLGFEWPIIDNEYLIKVLCYMMDQDFIGYQGYNKLK